MIHINNFVDKIKFFESKQSKDFIISLAEAKDLHADITKLLLVLEEYHSTIAITNAKKTSVLNASNSIDGGGW